MDPNKSRNFRYFKGLTTQKSHSLQNGSKHAPNKRPNKTKTRTKSLKKQIHDTQRLLFKNILSEEGVKSQQDKLDKLKKAYSEERRDRKTNKKFARYKPIKFFDKRKVLKKLNSLHKILPEADDEASSMLEKEFDLYKGYLNYIIYFPEDKKYISLFPNSERLDSSAQEQLDILLQEINSKVKEGLYANAWTAYLAKTPIDPIAQDSVLQEIQEQLINNPTPFPVSSTASPMFIPIDTDNQTSMKTKSPSSTKKQLSKKLHFDKSIDTSLDNHIKLQSTDDNNMSQMECAEDLRSDSFFFFDTMGSEVDTNLFKNRPQKRNFQDTRNPKPNPRNRNSKPNQKHRGHQY
ncbi:rRNA-processing protein EFG1-like [Oopsacas minuta]|uniref:rRNA-processing protein EFG1 n=1 Tax=Oopsacas minuta TaxID=111878 RepID=A0AAV7JV26_9METZ|nr:rRNA-processing protein EFG1-like [Oopsacas minuta]